MICYTLVALLAAADAQPLLYEAAANAPPLHADAASDAHAFAARTLAADTSGKLDTRQAAQLLLDAQELGASLRGGAARDRWLALQRRRRERLERAQEPCGGGGSADDDDDAGKQCDWQQTDHDSGMQQQPSSSQGILVVAGGVHGLSNAYVLIRALRHVGCALPVEVVHYGQPEYHAPTARLIQGLDGSAGGAGRSSSTSGDVRLIDGLEYHSTHLAASLAPHRPPPGGQITGFSTKVHALCFVTSFEWVLLLDADNLAVQVRLRGGRRLALHCGRSVNGSKL